MDADTTTAVAAIVFGTLMSLAPLLQAARVHRRHHSDDVSLGWLYLLIAGGSVWLARGLVTSDLPIILTNVVLVVAALVTLAVVLRYRGQDLV
ncbi:MAG: hypothetical protein JHC95_00205 [Solirubrobacteraceae bacterium]|nr:hypothetical protein [Solirubrobacteraceae bacterium]